MVPHARAKGMKPLFAVTSFTLIDIVHNVIRDAGEHTVNIAFVESFVISLDQ